MHSICLLLVICLAASCQAIRVDWGTNTGPIVPPPPRTTPAPPRQPYREPAPVWEDQSDDIPNPKPYVYVLPPPSRPRTWIIPAGPYAPANYNNLPPKRNYGDLLTPYSTPGAGAGTVTVPALAAQYVPGVGIKYTAIVPNKLQGKYNAKTKKYKAYEKAKYAPWNYLQLLPAEEKPLEWQAPLKEQEKQQEEEAELPQQSVSSSTTAAPISSSSTVASVSTESTTTLATTPSTTTTTTPKPTATTATTTVKLAHEKSAYLKKHNKLKKLIEMMQAQSNSSLTSS
ncbi:hypothetical protein ACLKA6_005971 [Drosophila palustris]